VPGTGGNAQFATMYVGYGPNGVNGSGSFTNQGAPFCEVDVTNQMTVGGDGAVGNVTLDGGMLCVTNPIHSALLIISNGTVVLNPPGTDVNTGAGWPGGVLYVDNLTMSNACGHLINYGQTLIISQTNLDPNLDADGTGMSNANKLLAGLDLFNPSSVFAITNVSLITNNNNQYIQVDWTTQGGHYYRLQASASLSGPFTNVGPQMFALGNGAGGLSYMDSTWAATNGPRFYRVLLGAAH